MPSVGSRDWKYCSLPSAGRRDWRYAKYLLKLEGIGKQASDIVQTSFSNENIYICQIIIFKHNLYFNRCSFKFKVVLL